MTDFNNDSTQGHFSKNDISRTYYALDNEHININVSVLSLSEESFSCKRQGFLDEKPNEQIREQTELEIFNKRQEVEGKNDSREEFPDQYYLCTDEQKEKLLARELPELPSRLRAKYESIISSFEYNGQKDVNRIGQEIIIVSNNREMTARDAYQMQMQLIKDGIAHFPWFDKEFKVLFSSCGNMISKVFGDVFIFFENISDHVKYCGLSEIKPGEIFVFNGDFTSRINVFTSSKIHCYDKVLVQLMSDTYKITEKEFERRSKKTDKHYHL